MCSNASITEILGINDKNLVILGNEKENIKGIEYTVLRGKLSYRPACCPKCGIVNENYDIIRNGSQIVKYFLIGLIQIYDKKHYNHEDLAFLLERKHSPKLIKLCV